MPKCIMGKIHMGPAPLPIGQIDRQTRVKTLPSRTTWRAVMMQFNYKNMGYRTFHGLDDCCMNI